MAELKLEPKFLNILKLILIPNKFCLVRKWIILKMNVGYGKRKLGFFSTHFSIPQKLSGSINLLELICWDLV